MDQRKKVFVSHAGEDRERFVRGFGTRLRADMGVDAWLSFWEIADGDDVVERVFPDGIGNADAVIVVLSRESIKKHWVREELNVSVSRKIQGLLERIIPVVIDDLEFSEIPVALQATSWHTIRNLENYDADLKGIVSSINGLTDKPPLGVVPAYKQTLVDIVPGLNEIDSLMLKLVGDTALAKKSTNVISTDAIIVESKELGIPEQEAIDALEILQTNYYLKSLGERRLSYPLNFSMTIYGFEQYAKTFVPDYASTVTAVVSAIVNAGERDSQTIALAVNQPIFIVEHILKWLKENGLIKAIKPIGATTMRITEVSVELKRRLQTY